VKLKDLTKDRRQHAHLKLVKTKVVAAMVAVVYEKMDVTSFLKLFAVTAR
jgi:hypothetical protein